MKPNAETLMRAQLHEKMSSDQTKYLLGLVVPSKEWVVEP